MIVVGTALATGMASMLVDESLDKEIPVIEINITTSIDRGNNIQVLGKADETLPAMVKEYFRLQNAKFSGKASKTTAASAAGKRVSPKTTNASAAAGARRVSPKTTSSSSAAAAAAASNVRRVSPKTTTTSASAAAAARRVSPKTTKRVSPKTQTKRD